MIPFWRGPQSKPQESAWGVPTHVVRWRGYLLIHVDLPVGLARDVDPAEVTAVVFGVSSSQEQLTPGLSGGVSRKKTHQNP